MRAIQKAVRVGGDPQIRDAERLVAEIDGMEGGLVKQQANAHLLLGSHYRNVDDEDGVIRHYSRLLALSAGLAGDEAIGFGTAASVNLAGVWVNRGDDKRAMTILDQAITRINATSGTVSAESQMMRQFLEDQRLRYSMIGQRAPSVEGKYWLNAPNDTAVIEMTGKVRLLVFTAHWCMPCQKSYPALKRLAAEFAPRGFEVVLATRLYGMAAGKKVSPDVELDLLREYYLIAHSLPFPIAVEEQPPDAPQTRPGPVSVSRNERSYHTAGLPEFVLVDRRGVIRRILFAGWDAKNEPALVAAIRASLEPQR